MEQNELVGLIESDDIFVSEVKAKEFMITGSSMLLFLFQWKNKNVDFFTMGSLIFGIQNKFPVTYFTPTILILTPPYPIFILFD